MKAVILLAGKGRRFGSLTENRHMAFIKLHNKSLLSHLIPRLIDGGVTEIVPVLGFDKDSVLSHIEDVVAGRIKVSPRFSEKYETTNNLYSLHCARDVLENEEFLLCNGDLVLSAGIIKDIVARKGESVIALDVERKSEGIDSPGNIVREGRIYDLGRHIPSEENGGYAIGVYRFNKELSGVFFNAAKKMLNDNLKAGFHDPLPGLFEKYEVLAHDIKSLTWTAWMEK